MTLPALRTLILRIAAQVGARNETAVHAVDFVVRCSAASTVAYVATTLVGLPHPVWAAMSALIVSQERWDDTRASLAGRILGTAIGVCVAVGVNAAAAAFGAPIAAQLALGVAFCAVIALGHPALRVAMWTVPIVLLTAEPSVPTALVALYRGCEVIIGALVGGMFHLVSVAAVGTALRCQRTLRQPRRQRT